VSLAMRGFGDWRTCARICQTLPTILKEPGVGRAEESLRASQLRTRCTVFVAPTDNPEVD
jgi:hypothetical protein